MRVLAALGLTIALTAHAAATPLHDATRRNDAAAIAALVEAGANPNEKDEQGNNPLHLAAILEHSAAFTALLGAGADPDETNKAGSTPLLSMAG